MVNSRGLPKPLEDLKPGDDKSCFVAIVLGVHGPVRLKSQHGGFYDSATITLGDDTCGQVELRLYGQDVIQKAHFREMQVVVVENAAVFQSKDKMGVWLKWRRFWTKARCYRDSQAVELLNSSRFGVRAKNVVRWRKKAHGPALRWARQGKLKEGIDED